MTGVSIRYSNNGNNVTYYLFLLSGCVTVDSVTCSFPFTYNGLEYWGCTTDDGDVRPWCSTDNTDEEIKKWGYCPTSCPTGISLEIIFI